MCPVCGLGTRVLETRVDEFTRVVRRRTCNNGHRFTTLEVVVKGRQRRQKYQRNAQIKAAYARLQNYSEVARHFKLSGARVREIILGPRPKK